MSATTKNQLHDTNNDYVGVYPERSRREAAGNLIQPGPVGGPYVFDAENHLIAAGGMAYPRLGTKEPGRISLLTRHSPLATAPSRLTKLANSRQPLPSSSLISSQFE